MSGTKISYVSGLNRIGQNDRSGRGKMLRSPEYIRFTQLSKGQFDLMVQMNLARGYADYSGDSRYVQAENMLNRALKGDYSLSGIGAVDPMLYDVAALIKKARKDVFPVSRLTKSGIGSTLFDCTKYVYDTVLSKRLEIVKSVYGANYESPFRQDVNTGVVYSTAYSNKSVFNKAIYASALQARNECALYDAVEDIYNQKLEGIQHHTVYNQIDPDWKYLPTKAYTKTLLHVSAREGLANYALINQVSFKAWMDSLMIRRNMVTNGIEAPINSIDTGFSVNSKSDRIALWKLYKATSTTAKRNKTTGVGEPITIAAVTALVVAIGGAIAAAATMQQRLNEKRNGALSEIRGFGTSGLSGNPNDWDGDGILNDDDDTPNGPQDQSTSPISTETMLLIGGGLAAAYFLTQD